MTIYDIYGTQHHASLCVQDDGEKVWTLDPLWEDFWHEAARQKVMEQALDNEPHAAVIYAEGFTIRKREASPGSATECPFLLAQETPMAPHISGRLHWDTTHAATPGWRLFLDGLPGEAPRMLPEFETSLPREASHAEVARLIEDMLSRETGHRPQQVQVTQVEDAPVYAFVATYEGPA